MRLLNQLNPFERRNFKVDTTKDNYLQDLFINEAKPALDRHSGSGGDKPSQTKIVEITEKGG